MADWQRTLNVADVWPSTDLRLISRTAAERMQELEPFTGYLEAVRQRLINDLLDLANDPDATVEQFDALWGDVYDWGDISLDGEFNGKKVCWIATF